MTKGEVINSLKGLVGEWSEDRAELVDRVEYWVIDDTEVCKLEDYGGYILIRFLDDDEIERAVLVEIEPHDGWQITRVA